MTMNARQPFFSFCMISALCLALLVAGTGALIAGGSYPLLARLFFWQQDAPLLLLYSFGFLVFAFWPNKDKPEGAIPDFGVGALLPALAAVLLIGWAGRTVIMHDYDLSRDEVMAEFAARLYRDGRLALPIPAEWVDYRRAILPDSFAPWGAADYWASAYFPLNSAFRAMLGAFTGDALVAPLMLVGGLWCLFGAARLIFAGAPTGIWTTMLLALGSAQLLFTAMTPFAMTAHFALNSLWLYAVLKGGRWHGVAAVALFAATGLHQWHFAPTFLFPFILWFLLNRKWKLAGFHGLALILSVLIWSRLWPGFLEMMLGPQTDVLFSSDIAAKFGSLLGRITDAAYQPLYLSRLAAWNGMLAVPLAVFAMGSLGRAGRSSLSGPFFPLALLCFIGLLCANYQSYGWGYRYMHGHLPALFLLAGEGARLLREKGYFPRKILFAGVAINIAALLFLAVQVERWVRPYAAAYAAIRSSAADVVIVDPHGGIYRNDLVRFSDKWPEGPVVMSLTSLTPAMVDRLCRQYRVRLFDEKDLSAVGLPVSGPVSEKEGVGPAARRRAALLKSAECSGPPQLIPSMPD